MNVELIADTVARRAPRHDARPAMRVRAIAPLGGGISGLLVTARRRDRGETWYRVLLPRRPNGSQGWISERRLRVLRNPYRISIDLSDRTLTLSKNGRRALRTTISIGRPSAPTPPGRYAVAENIRTNAPRSYLGAHALPLTGFSERLRYFMGGSARLAIHGTNRPGLIGSASSHGCNWVAADPLRRIAALAQPGTPVLIRR